MGQALQRLEAHLDACAARAEPRVFWWRDDDATKPGPRLSALLERAAAAGARVAVAAIPASAEPALLAACKDAGADLLQHGIAHENHQTAGKATELGDARDVTMLVEALVAARGRLSSPAFVPVVVPPWNRMRADLAPALAAAGYVGVSLFGGSALSAPIRRVDTHIDPIAWRTTRSLADEAVLERMVDAAIAQEGPIGLLTHHIAHDEAIDGFVSAFAALVAAHRGAQWVSAGSLFGRMP